MSVPGGQEMRIGDDEREAAVAALGEHYAAGRLTKEEYDERSERAWAARTQAALLPLFADLPRPGRPAPEPTRNGPPLRGPGRAPGRRHPGWWEGAWLVPVLALVAAFVVLTHLPLILLIVLAWVFLARSGRHFARRGGCGPRGRSW